MSTGDDERDDASDTGTDDATEQARRKRKKRIDRIMWSVLGLTVASTIAWRCVTGSRSDGGSFAVQCVPKAPRDISCSFLSEQASAGVCVDLVMICDNREHRSEVCSGALKAGIAGVVDVYEMTPPLSAKPNCAAPRYENERTAD